MWTVLSLCVIISAALACPIEKPSCSLVPKICPSEWKVVKFESQYATIAFQGLWHVQATSLFREKNGVPTVTGLFCNCFPSTLNDLLFTDTTPNDSGDFNTSYEMIDLSFNINTQTIEKKKLLLTPAYGKSNKYAIFHVSTPGYYQEKIFEKCPLFDKDLIKPKLEGNYVRECIIAVIGVDKDWSEYMILGVINKYNNFFCGNENLIFLLTRDLVPDRSTYRKAYEDIERNGLTARFLMSVDHSYNSIASSLSSTGSLIPSISSVPSITSDDIDTDSVIQKSSTSTQSVTKSVNIGSDCDSSYSSSTSTSTTTVQTISNVLIEKSSDFSSLYDIGRCDLYNRFDNIQIYKAMDLIDVRKALSGKYFMIQGSPCSISHSPTAKFGMLNNGFPGCGFQIMIDDSCMEPWDFNTPYMFMDRAMDLRTGKIHETRGFLTSVYPADHDFSSTTFSLYYEGYSEDQTVNTFDFSLDGMICKQPYDIYKHQLFVSIVGYKNGEYLILCVANQFKNPFYDTNETPIILCYTRDQTPDLTIMKNINQEILRCGFKPYDLVKFDQMHKIDNDYVFNRKSYESKITSFSSTRSLELTLGESPSLNIPKICPSNWCIKSFDSQLSTLALQGLWHVQATTPFKEKNGVPTVTGLFCNCFPSTLNDLIFTDTTPNDSGDFNTSYEMIDLSFNINTQTIEKKKLLLTPAYGKSNKYAIFHVSTPGYYQEKIFEKCPLFDKDLIKPKLEGNYVRECIIAVIGVDKDWSEYMILGVINKYNNFFCGNENLIFLLTRDLVPDRSTYRKAYEDIERNGLTARFLMSVDHSYNSIASSLSSTGSLIPSISSVPSITSDDIDTDSVIQKSSTSTQSVTKSVNIGSDCDSSYSSSTSTSTTTVQTISNVLIEKSSDFSSLYDIGRCDLYNRFDNIQIYKAMDLIDVRKALSGKYFMIQGSPCSISHSPTAKFGMLNNGFPGCGFQIMIDDSCMEPWDFNTPYMFMDRAMDLRTGKIHETRGFLTSVYPADHDFSSTTFSLYYEGYSEDQTVNTFDFSLDGMICKQPYDIYKHQLFVSIVGYKNGEYLILCVANQFKNPFYDDESFYHLYCYARDRTPSQNILYNMNQEILRCGYDPNKLVKIDQTVEINECFTFDRSYFESTTSCWSSSTTESSCTTSFSSSHSSSKSLTTVEC